MLDIGWVELSIIAMITILVVGPKEIPRVLRTVTQVVRKVRSMASEFQSGIDDLAREAELDDLKKDIEKTASKDLADDLENTIDPTGEVTESVREIEASLKEDPRESSETKTVADAIRDSTPTPPPADKPKKNAPNKGAVAKKSKSA
jgi:sec-independent protein translocase protein TatB